MGLTETEMLGVDENVLVLYTKERVALIKAGLEVDVLTGTLSLQVEEAKTANAVQEGLKRQLKAATRVAEAKVRKAYITASGMLDMAIADVDKTSDAAKNFRRIRSRVRRPDELDEVVPLPEPTPSPK